MPSRPVRVFYSYSHVDEALMRNVKTHLAMLRRRGLVEEWFDRDIEAGQEWREEIAAALEQADLVLLFISADFLDSDFCYEEEMGRALERVAEGTARVIAVMLRPVDGWQESPFAHLQITPQDGRPVSTWPDRDQALADVASRIRRVVERIRADIAPDAPERALTDGDVRGSELVNRLTVAVDDLRAPQGDRFLVAEIDPYYAQFLVEDDGDVWCELVSNANLDPDAKLTAEQEAALATLGWNPPEETLPNWWWPAPNGSSSSDIAAFVVKALLEVYRVEPTASFAFETGS